MEDQKQLWLWCGWVNQQVKGLFLSLYHLSVSNKYLLFFKRIYQMDFSIILGHIHWRNINSRKIWKSWKSLVPIIFFNRRDGIYWLFKFLVTHYLSLLTFLSSYSHVSPFKAENLSYASSDSPRLGVVCMCSFHSVRERTEGTHMNLLEASAYALRLPVFFVLISEILC